MWPEYSAACIADIAKLLRKGGSLSAYRASSAYPDWIGPKEGSQVYAFEREVEKAFGVKHCVAVNSGTAALHAALVAIGVEGREVITTPYTFSATSSAILLAGGIPRFADVDPFNFSITPETVKPHITKRTAAILPVHLFGYFQDLEGFKQFGVPVVEDACQAVGAVRGGSSRDRRFAGTAGRAGAISYNGSKNLPTGEGGALVTNDSKLAEKARLFSNHGENFGLRRKRAFDGVGVNYRMHEVVAIIARHGLRELEERNAKRIALVDRVQRNAPIKAPTDGSHVYYVVPTLLRPGRDRRTFIQRCAKRGLAVQAGYTLPLHHLPAFKRYAHGPLPVVDDVHDRLVLLTNLTPDKPLAEADRTASIIAEALK